MCAGDGDGKGEGDGEGDDEYEVVDDTEAASSKGEYWWAIIRIPTSLL